MTRIIQDTTAAIAYNLIRQRRDTLPAGKTWQEYDNALRDLTPTSPDEHSITMAGGDGEPNHAPDPQHQRPGYGYWCICNVRFHDPYALAAHVASAIEPAPRTEDWKVSELFGEYPAENLRSAGATCFECGALVTNLFDHVTWHNKLLP